MHAKILVIVGAVIVAAGLIGGGIFLFYQGKNAASLSIEFIHPDRVPVGEPFPVEIQVGNSSDHLLEDVRLTVELPPGMAFVGSAEEKDVESKSLGTLGVGSLTKEHFDLIALAGEDTIASLKATVTYRTPSLQSEFEKNASVDLPVQGSVVLLDLTLPEKIFSGESFGTAISYKNTGDLDLKNLELTVSFPPSYTLTSSTIDTEGDVPVWDLGDLRKGSEGKIETSGNIIGPDGAFFEVVSTLTAEFGGRRYTLAEKTGSIGIEASPLSLDVALKGDQSTVRYPGDDLDYELRIVNNTDIAFKDIVISAGLLGELFDMSTISSSAFLKSVDNTLIWNAGNTSGLDTLKPGESRTTAFHIRLKKDYPIKRLSDKNFVLTVKGKVESPTTPYFVEAKKTLTVKQLETKIGGKIEMEILSLFRDAASGILNKGPWPMKVGQKTQFTIHWRIKNYATDVANINVRAFLGGNVTLVGTPKSNISSIPTYNANTQELSWDIANIAATKGIISTPVEAIFQVEASPSITDVGGPMKLLGDTTIMADDVFTGEALSDIAGEVKTNNLTDPTVKTDEGMVKE